ncbi:FAD-dependent oxidoreductase [candidate division KSB1 bacterium]|nr:FAD-dependent oxidoreductase [candidate division KSB1 bacterium]
MQFGNKGKEAGKKLESRVQALGVKLHKNVRVKEIVGDERVRGVLLENEKNIQAELVIITTGVRSNSYIARLAGLDVNQGIVVNNRLQTSNAEIFAAGDVAEHRGVTYGTWSPAQFQGTIAGMNAAGGNAEFAGIPRSNMLKVLGYDMFSIGETVAEDASYQIVASSAEENYYFFMFRDNRLIGSILMGDTKLSAPIKNVVEKRQDCSDLLNKNPGIQDVFEFVKYGIIDHVK